MSDAAGPAAPEEAVAVHHDDWESHWDSYSEAAARNPAQWYRRREALRLLSEDGPPTRLLDIGSGTGDLLFDAAARWPSAELAGVEMAASGNAVAARSVPSAKLTTIDLLEEEPPDELLGWATHAVCSEVLEHVDDPALFLRRAKRMLATGARLVVTVPGGQMSAFDHHIGHRQHFTPDSLAAVFADAGLRSEMTTGLGYPFFNLYRRVVIARGEKLVDEVASDDGVGTLAGIAMAAFKPLLAVSRPNRKRGIQIAGVARLA